MKNWTKKINTVRLMAASPSSTPAPGPFDNLSPEDRKAAMKAAIKEVIDAKLNKGNN